jgi:hypothetical protein
MKRKTLIVLISVCVIAVVLLFLLWRSNLLGIQSRFVEIEVTLGHPATRQVGISTYHFKLYNYPLGEEELTGMYMLRVEKGTDFTTKVVVSGHTYRLLELEVNVVKLISAGVLLEVKIAD